MPLEENESQLSNEILKDLLQHEANEIQNPPQTEVKKNKGGNIKGSKRKPYKSKNNPTGEVKNEGNNNKSFENNIDDSDVGGNKNPKPPEEKKPTETTKPETESGKKKLADILNEYKEIPINESQEKKEGQTGSPNQQATAVQITQADKVLINGHLLLVMCDSFFPFAIKLVVGIFMPQIKKVENTKMRLTKDQRESLEPLADKCAQYIFENISPVALFVFAISSCYISNALEHAPEK